MSDKSANRSHSVTFASLSSLAQWCWGFNFHSRTCKGQDLHFFNSRLSLSFFFSVARYCRVWESASSSSSSFASAAVCYFSLLSITLSLLLSAPASLRMHAVARRQDEDASHAFATFLFATYTRHNRCWVSFTPCDVTKEWATINTIHIHTTALLHFFFFFPSPLSLLFLSLIFSRARSSVSFLFMANFFRPLCLSLSLFVTQAASTWTSSVYLNKQLRLFPYKWLIVWREQRPLFVHSMCSQSTAMHVNIIHYGRMRVNINSHINRYTIDHEQQAEQTYGGKVMKVLPEKVQCNGCWVHSTHLSYPWPLVLTNWPGMSDQKQRERKCVLCDFLHLVRWCERETDRMLSRVPPIDV